MPLKSKASDARQARAAKAPEAVQEPLAPSLPEHSADPEVREPAVAKKQRAARTPNPSVAERKAATERMKAILKEVKSIKAEKATALRAVERQFEDKQRNLQAEYSVLTTQLARAAFS